MPQISLFNRPDNTKADIAEEKSAEEFNAVHVDPLLRMMDEDADQDTFEAPSPKPDFFDNKHITEDEEPVTHQLYPEHHEPLIGGPVNCPESVQKTLPGLFERLFAQKTLVSSPVFENVVGCKVRADVGHQVDVTISVHGQHCRFLIYHTEAEIQLVNSEDLQKQEECAKFLVSPSIEQKEEENPATQTVQDPDFELFDNVVPDDEEEIITHQVPSSRDFVGMNTFVGGPANCPSDTLRQVPKFFNALFAKRVHVPVVVFAENIKACQIRADVGNQVTVTLQLNGNQCRYVIYTKENETEIVNLEELAQHEVCRNLLTPETLAKIAQKRR